MTVTGNRPPHCAGAPAEQDLECQNGRRFSDLFGALIDARLLCGDFSVNVVNIGLRLADLVAIIDSGENRTFSHQDTGDNGRSDQKREDDDGERAARDPVNR
jgi:hypothetical protein